MPTRHLEAYAAELPILQAEASLRRAQEVAVGAGIDPKQRSSIVGGWRRAATGSATARLPKGQLAVLAQAAGIGVRTVRRRKAGKP